MIYIKYEDIEQEIQFFHTFLLLLLPLTFVPIWTLEYTYLLTYTIPEPLYDAYTHAHLSISTIKLNVQLYYPEQKFQCHKSS